jgi:lysophospholipase II
MTQPPHIIPPTGPHTHTIIFLHSRGSTAEAFASALFQAHGRDWPSLPAALPSVKWVFPRSGLRAASARDDEMVPQWFDMHSVERPQERGDLQLAGLRDSVAAILRLADAEEALFAGAPPPPAGAPERVVLAGLSQGCAAAAHALLRSGRRFAAFVGLSGWLPFVERVEGICAAEAGRVGRMARARREMLGWEGGGGGQGGEGGPSAADIGACLATPVFLSYCRDDDVVPVVNGVEMCKGLRSLGLTVRWNAYDTGGHWLNEPRGVDDLVRFMLQWVVGTSTGGILRIHPPSD